MRPGSRCGSSWAGVAAVCLAVFAAFPPGAEAQTIWDVLVSRTDVVTSRQYLQQAGLDTVLRQATPFLTVFIPTEAAWDAAGRGAERFLAVSSAQLSDTLRYHVVSGASLNSVQASTGSPLTTLQGSTVSVTQSIPTSGSGQTGFVVNGEAAITTMDLAGSNGMIHLVNRVLVPSSGSLTPRRTIYEHIRANPAVFSTLDGYLQTDTTLVATLNQRVPRWNLNGVPGSGSDVLYTFFAPTNAAFSALNALQLSELQSSAPLLQRVLNHHASATYLPYRHGLDTPGVNVTLDLPTFDSPNTLVYSTLATPAVNLTTAVDFTRVFPTVNGIIVYVDAVILPPAVLLPLNIVEVLSGRSDTATTAGYATSTGLAQYLANAGLYTMFAPTDVAWKKLKSGELNLIQRDTAVAQAVLSYHILQGVGYSSLQLRTVTQATTVQGGTVRLAYNLNGAGSIYVNTDSKVVFPDQAASNGVVHVVDTVLVPPISPFNTLTSLVGAVGSVPVHLSRIYQILVSNSEMFNLFSNEWGGPYTFLAPSDAAFAGYSQSQLDALVSDQQKLSVLLKYHTVPAYVSVADFIAEHNRVNSGNPTGVTRSTYNTLYFDSTNSNPNNETLAALFSSGFIKFYDGQAKEGIMNRSISDIPATNGVVHIIDSLLLPSAQLLPGNTVVDEVARRPDSSIFYDLLRISGASLNLQQTGPFTVFAVTNAGLAKLGSGVIPYYRRRVAELQTVLLHHTVAGSTAYAANTLVANSPLQSQQGELLRIAKTSSSGTGLVVDASALITLPDVSASNGIVHFVDAFLPPTTANHPRKTVYDYINAGGYNEQGLNLKWNAYKDISFRSNQQIGDVYKEAGPITVFVWDDVSFEGNVDATVRQLLSGAPVDAAYVGNAMRYHVVNQYLDVADLVSSAPGNLLTRDAPYTIAYAISAVTSRILLNGKVDIKATIPAHNGIIHVITDVLSRNNLFPSAPPSGLTDSLWDLLSLRPDLSTFYGYARVGSVNYLLSSTERRTLFAPKNDALNNVPSGWKELFTRNASLLHDLVKYHILDSGSYSASVLPTISPAQSAVAGQNLIFSQNSVHILIEANRQVTGSALLNQNRQATIQIPDIAASNGLLHVTDTLLVPASVATVLPFLDLYSVIEATPKLSQLLSAITTASSRQTSSIGPNGNLVSALKGTGPLTVFAPSNTAFQAYPLLASLMTWAPQSNSEEDPLLTLLQHHVHAGYKEENDLRTQAPTVLTTLATSTSLNGNNIDVKSEAGGTVVVLGGISRFEIINVRGTNGVLHIIDTVLPATLPPGVSRNTLQDVLQNRAETTDFARTTPSVGLYNELSSTTGTGNLGPYTVFAPSNLAWSSLPVGVKEVLSRRLDVLTNVMRFHVISGLGLTAISTPTASPAVTLQGNSMSLEYNQQTGVVRLQGSAQTLFTDIQATNGVAHVIDQVLDYPSSPLPKQNLLNVISSDPSLSTFSAFLRASAAGALLASVDPTNTKVYTVLAPTDAAWQRLPLATQQAVMQDPESFIREHIIEDEYISAGDFHATSPGQKVNLNQRAVSYRIGVVTQGSTPSRQADVLQQSGGSVVVFNYQTTQPSSVVGADIPATNGVVHQIDASLVGATSGTPGTPATPTPVVGVPPTPSPVQTVPQNLRVLVWGNAAGGGDASTVQAALSASPIRRIYSNDFAFAALLESGMMVTWGEAVSGGAPPPITGLSPITQIFSSRAAFAALRSDGSVIAWGDSLYGGDAAAASVKLACCVSSVYSTSRAFAAVLGSNINGAVVAAWGDTAYGGAIPTTAQTTLTQMVSSGQVIQRIASNDGAFAALVSVSPTSPASPNVVTWGIANQGGDSSTVSASLAGVTDVVSTYSAFAAVTASGNVVTWGAAATGGDSATVRQLLSAGNIRSITGTTNAFAALTADGSVIAWGAASGGGDARGVQSQLTGVASIASTDSAFAALKSDGTVVTWGGSGGDSAASQGALVGVADIAATDSAFAARTSSGTVVTWGSTGFGGAVPQAKQGLLSGVRRIYSNSRAFAAVRNDNTVVAWGETTGGGSAQVPLVATEALLLTPATTTPGQERIVTASDAAFAAYIGSPPDVTSPSATPVPTPPPGGNVCGVLFCNGNHISFSLVGGTCVCSCKPAYIGERCGSCAVGYVNYPICSFAVVTPVPWFLPPTPMPSGVTPPPTPSPTRLPLPTSPPTNCLAWSACNGHAASVSDSPLGGCICNCLANFAGDQCDTCASGYAGYPICSAGNWVLVSDTHACRLNAEDTQAVHGSDTDLLPSQLACQQSCAERTWCRAIDWYRTTQRCRMYSESCADPLDPLDGGSHWRLVIGAGPTTPIPTPVPTVEQGCPWVSPTGRDDEYDCGDGSTCNLRLDGSDCCNNRRGRLRCPMNYPVMCSSVDNDCDNDYCCVEFPEDCSKNGGQRPCTGMDVTPCGLAAEGGDAAVWFSGQKARQPLVPPLIRNIRGVFSNTAAYVAVTMEGAGITWGADFAGGDSSTVAADLATGLVKVFSTDKAFAALKTGGEVVSWGDNGLGAVSDTVLQLLRRDVMNIYTTSNAFAALKINGGVVTWGHRYYGGDSETVAGSIASDVRKVFATKQAFAALTNKGAVVAWGAPHEGGGNANSVQPLLQADPGVRDIANTDSAFAAIRNDGRVVTWGYPTRGGDSSTISALLTRDALQVVGNTLAFALLKANRSVVTWGEGVAGGDSSTVSQLLASSVVSIHTTDSAFAAIRSDRSVVVWGDAQAGGLVPDAKRLLLRNVLTITSTQRAFTALLGDGTAVMWGDAGYGGVYPAGNSLTNVRVVHGNSREFAAIQNDGKIVVWGNAQGAGVGSDYKACATQLDGVPAYRYGLGVRSVVSSANSFAFLTEPENTPAPTATPAPNAPPAGPASYYPVKVWGDTLTGGSIPSTIGAQLTCGSLFATRRSFAAIKADGSVVAWGDAGYGGDATTVAHRLGGGVRAIFSTDRAFAALTDGGSVVVWGDYGFGGNADPTTAAKIATGVQNIYSTQLAFAAVKTTGEVVTWGDRYYGGDTVAVAPFLQSGVVGIYSTDQAFAALKTTGEVITWGAGFAGADSSQVREQLRSGVQAMYTTYSAFAALKTGGSVVTWGYSSRGGDSSTVAGDLLAGVQAIASTEMAFAALKKQQGTLTAGTVITWGDTGYGGDSASVRVQLSSGVKAVYATQRAFAAVKTDGSVVAWGNATFGGLATQVASQLSGVEEIFTTERAFAALLNTGRVVTWGDSGFGGSSAVSQGLSDVRMIYATQRAFTALRADGSLVSWGDSEYGGSIAGIDASSASNHKAVYSTDSAFAALNPCPLGSKLRSLGGGACKDGNDTRYSELKTEAVDRAACLQILLQHSPPARGATWWADAPLTASGVGGCYIAVDVGTTISGGTWIDRHSYDTSPNDPNAQRVGKGPVALGDAQAGMECIAAEDVATVPTPPPGTPLPTAAPTPVPAPTTYAWSLTEKGASCEINNEGIQPTEHVHPLPTLEACMRTCESRVDCRAVDYTESGWCNLYAKPCVEPLDVRPGVETWRYVEGNGAGFAAVAWGDAATGGDTSSVISAVNRGVKAIYSNELAFAALKTDGTVVTWGGGFAGGDSSTVREQLRTDTAAPVVDVVGTDRAFAARSSTGAVVSWGDSLTGGSYASVASLLTSGVRRVYAADAAFAAIAPVGIVAWGDQAAGGDATTVRTALLPTQSYDTVQATERAFAALTNDGRVVAWGDILSGGDTSTVALELMLPNRRVTSLQSTERAFAAIRDDGSVVTWGDSSRGGDMTTVSSLLMSGVHRIYSTQSAFAALKVDGTVVAWGDTRSGGTGPQTDNVRFIVSADRAFVAVRSDGTAVTWGDPTAGGVRPATPVTNTYGVQVVVGNSQAFAAVLSNGVLDAWGNAAGGGTLPTILNTSTSYKLQYLTGTSEAFAGLTEAGTVIAWGNTLAGGNVNPVASQLARGVVSISSTTRAFAALVTTLFTQPVLPPTSELAQCTEDQWVQSPLKRCIEGQDQVDQECDKYEILGGTVDRYRCAYKRQGAAFVCVKCLNIVQGPDATAAPPAPTTDNPTGTSGNAHTVTVCSEPTDKTTGDADQSLVIACPAGGGTLAIHNVYYGRPVCSDSNAKLCEASSLSVTNCGTSECKSDTILQEIRDMCQGETACTLTTTANITDPCAGVSKYLQVAYTCQAFVCEQQSALQWGRVTGQSGDQRYDLSCASDRELVIDYAVFGRTTCHRHICYSFPGSNCATQDCSAIVTTSVSEKCDGKQTCQVTALSTELGITDPCPGENKYLDVGYTCQGKVVQVSTGACRDMQGGYYRELKSSQADRAACAKLLRTHQPHARAAMFWPGRGCYIAVDFDSTVRLEGTTWDSENSTDSFSGVRRGTGPNLLASNSPQDTPAGAVCLIIGATSVLPPVVIPPSGTGGGVVGNGLCGQPATSLGQCIDSTNAYWCNGLCCCEEQREWRCDVSTGQCKYKFTPTDTLLPAPTATAAPAPVVPATASPPVVPPPGGPQSTFPPDPTPPPGLQGAAGSDDSSETTWIILLIVLGILCLCCVLLAFYCGSRNSKKKAAEQAASESHKSPGTGPQYVELDNKAAQPFHTPDPAPAAFTPTGAAPSESHADRDRDRGDPFAEGAPLARGGSRHTLTGSQHRPDPLDMADPLRSHDRRVHYDDHRSGNGAGTVPRLDDYDREGPDTDPHVPGDPIPSFKGRGGRIPPPPLRNPPESQRFAPENTASPLSGSPTTYRGLPRNFPSSAPARTR